MSGKSWTFEWRERPPGLIDAMPLQPDRLADMSLEAVRRVELRCSRRLSSVAELFDVREMEREGTPTLEIGGCETLLRLGAGMRAGRLRVHGHAGSLAAAEMRGGELYVDGDAGNLLAAGMQGGLVRVSGDAGDLVGGPTPGADRGMRGGEVLVSGNAGERVGLRLRRGTIAIAGEVGTGLGHHQIAGTIVVLRGAPDRPGVGMRRGTILCLGEAPTLTPSFVYSGRAEPVFFRVLTRHLERLGFPLSSGESALHAWSGDHTQLGRGEVLSLREKAEND